ATRARERQNSHSHLSWVAVNLWSARTSSQLVISALQWIRTTDLVLLLALSVAARPVVLAPLALRAPGTLNAGRGASKTSRRARRRVRRLRRRIATGPSEPG